MPNGYIRFEVEEVAEVTHENGQRTCTVVRGDTDRQSAAENGGRIIWSLYGRLPTGEAECIGDFGSKEAAEGVRDRIGGRLLEALTKLHNVCLGSSLGAYGDIDDDAAEAMRVAKSEIDRFQLK